MNTYKNIEILSLNKHVYDFISFCWEVGDTNLTVYMYFQN